MTYKKYIAYCILVGRWTLTVWNIEMITWWNICNIRNTINFIKDNTKLSAFLCKCIAQRCTLPLSTTHWTMHNTHCTYCTLHTIWLHLEYDNPCYYHTNKTKGQTHGLIVCFLSLDNFGLSWSGLVCLPFNAGTFYDIYKCFGKFCDVLRHFRKF